MNQSKTKAARAARFRVMDKAWKAYHEAIASAQKVREETIAQAKKAYEEEVKDE